MTGASGFFGLPVAGAPQAGRAALLAVTAMTPYPGALAPCAGAPDALRSASAAVTPGRWDMDLGRPLFAAPPVDLGAFPLSGDAETDRAKLARRTADIIAAGARPLIIGGDDSVAIPPLLGLESLNGGVHLVQIDAHLDWKDRRHGEAWGRSSVMRRASEMPWVKTITQIGLRGCGSAEPQDAAAAHARAKIITAQMMQTMRAEDMIKHIPGGNVYVTLDLDGVNPAEMPAVISPSAGGPGADAIIALLLALAGKRRLAGANLVEYAPAGDGGGPGLLTALRLLTVLADVLSAEQAAGGSDFKH